MKEHVLKQTTKEYIKDFLEMWIEIYDAEPNVFETICYFNDIYIYDCSEDIKEKFKEITEDEQNLLILSLLEYSKSYREHKTPIREMSEINDVCNTLLDIYKKEKTVMKTICKFDTLFRRKLIDKTVREKFFKLTDEEEEFLIFKLLTVTNNI